MDTKYKRMIEGMRQKEEAAPKALVKKKWCVYVLRCSDGSLYTGITTDLERRVRMHNSGKGAKYTKTRAPVAVVFARKRLSRSQALVRECAIKALPKKEKEALVGKST